MSEQRFCVYVLDVPPGLVQRSQDVDSPSAASSVSLCQLPYSTVLKPPPAPGLHQIGTNTANHGEQPPKLAVERGRIKHENIGSLTQY